MTIKAIIFDIGGVIYTGKQRSNDYMAELLKIDKEVWVKATEEIWERLLRGKIREKEGLIEMAKNLGIDKNRLKRLWEKTFRDRYVLNKDLLKIIKKLKKNYKMAILSDQWSISYRFMLTKEVKSDFDVMVFSHYVGFRKPSKDIYHIVLRKLHLEPNECVFIDDFEYNLIPAREMGMKTILFKNNKQLKTALKKIGVK